MKLFYRISIYLLLAASLINCVAVVHAADFGFDTEILTEERVSDILKNIEIKKISQAPQGGSICCFDVNQGGAYALGSPGATVCIYDVQGIFQYGFRFRCESTYAIELTEDECLSIYFNRSGFIATFDANGTCVSIEDVLDSKENLNHIYDVIDITHKTVGQTTYRLDRDFGIGSAYSKFVKTDELGKEIILYDVSLGYNIVNSVVILGMCAFVLFVAYKSLAPFAARLRDEGVND